METRSNIQWTRKRTAYRSKVVEVGYGFKFGHKFCSPCCEEVKRGSRGAETLDKLKVEQIITEWGVTQKSNKTSFPYRGTGAEDDVYHYIVNNAIACKQTQLDLVETVAYYQYVKLNDPWGRIERLKSYDREGDTFEKSLELYEELGLLPAFATLPEILVPNKLATYVQEDNMDHTHGYSLICR